MSAKHRVHLRDEGPWTIQRSVCGRLDEHYSLLFTDEEDSVTCFHCRQAITQADEDFKRQEVE